ncbi:MAG: sodium-dependent bicarbonate transport family permease [Myxococcales bacterium]|nr:sodium-dependent bicarbonate transport family permease [Myxococcales bacterium]
MDLLLAFFLFGVIARALRSELAFPPALHDSLSIVLLLTIGLKGGVELAAQSLAEVWLPALCVVAMGCALTGIAYLVLSTWVRLPKVDAAAVAAHYGSVSVGTFAVASASLAAKGVPFEPSFSLFVVLLEAPAIFIGVALARRGARSETRSGFGAVAQEILRGKSLVLLVGGLAIGWGFGADGLAPITPLFFGGFKGLLALFLLDMGLVCGDRLSSLRRHGARLVVFAVAMPLFAAGLGMALAKLLGFSVGGTAMLATLAASASYIAAPAALRIAVPEANPTLSLTAALGITFPFNIAIGIPLYLEVARQLP